MRVSVVGNSGSGKSTLAAQLAAALGVDHLELDSIHHQADWRPLPPERFRQQVAAFAATPSWVIDGNYSAARPIVWARAQVVVWLDLPRWLVMSRLLRRTAARCVRRTELWNGNRESLTNMVRGGGDNVVLWAWRHHAVYRERYAAAARDPSLAHIHFVRVRRAADAAPGRVLARMPVKRPNQPG